MADDGRDPGWGPAARNAWKGMVPASATRRLDGLSSLRLFYVATLLALLLIGLVLWFMGPGEERLDRGTALVILATVAAVGTSIVGMIRSRPLRGSGPGAVAGAYRARTFVRIAVAEWIALLGFVLFFFTGTSMTYLVAVTLAVPAYAMAAPTAGDIARHQEGLNEHGIGIDLLGALLGVRPAG